MPKTLGSIFNTKIFKEEAGGGRREEKRREHFEHLFGYRSTRASCSMLLRLKAGRSATAVLLKTSRSGMAKYCFDPARNRTVRKHMSMDLRHHVVLRGRRSLYPDLRLPIPGM